MKVYVHFLAQRPAPGRVVTPPTVRLFNIYAIRQEIGTSTLVAVNYFGGEPQTFDGVRSVVCEPEDTDPTD